MTKQELITTEPKKEVMAIDNCVVKFDGKINTTDLIESVLFEREEEIELNLQKVRIEKDKTEQKYKKDKESISNYIKKLQVKDKKVETLAKLLNELTKSVRRNDEFKIHYESILNEGKLYNCANISNRYYNIDCEMPMKIDAILKKLIDSKNKSKEEFNKLIKKHNELITDKNKLPTLKKKIKATFVKSLIADEKIKSNKDIVEKLRSVILEF